MVNTLMPWTDEVVNLRQAMDRLLSEAFVGAPFRTLWSHSGASVLPLDVYATADEAVILAAAPGMNPQALDVTINEDTVTIAGTIPDVAESKEAQGAAWYVDELPSGQFRRSVTLPFPLDASHAQASYEQGIIKVVIPKAAHAKPTRIAISTGTQQAITGGTAAS